MERTRTREVKNFWIRGMARYNDADASGDGAGVHKDNGGIAGDVTVTEVGLAAEGGGNFQEAGEL